MHIGTTNKLPEIVSHHYIHTVLELGGVPTRIRSDDGTEISSIEPMQIALRSRHDDQFAGVSSFIVGSSPANQRIESFWSQLTKDRPIWWRQLFSHLSGLGYLDTKKCTYP